MSRSRFDLGGMSAVVTGAGSGIGRETALALSEAGAAVLIADIDEKGGAGVVEEIRSAGRKAAFARADVTKLADCEGMVAACVRELGRIDVLVNNAGIVLPGNCETTTEADFDKTFAVNVKGMFLACKAAIPAMVKQGGGHLINIASIAGMVAILDRFAYCASKGAVIAMTRQIAIDYVGKGVRCNCICPGTIHTPLVDKYYREFYAPKGVSKEEMLKMLGDRQPMGRLGRPDEIAGAVVYLASPAAAFATGSSLVLDGGLTAR
jgi:NAD(P)-dependent dehydrogenase (short-subunit alcohol dehydrogenase family)